MESLGERIKAVRQSRNLTQQQFAEELSVSRPFISRVESNKETPSDSLLKLISFSFEVSYKWLTSGEGSMFAIEIDASTVAIAQAIDESFVSLTNRISRAMENCNEHEKKMVFDVLFELLCLLSTKTDVPVQKTIAIESARHIFCYFTWLIDKCFRYTGEASSKQDWIDEQYEWYAENSTITLNKLKSEFLYGHE